MNEKYESNGIIVETVYVKIGKLDHITNSYLVYDKSSNEGIIIDPGDEKEKIIQAIVSAKVNVKYIVLTHTHYDHIIALKDIQEYTNAKVLVHKEDIDGLTDDEKNHSTEMKIGLKRVNMNNVVPVEDGFKFEVGKMNFEVIHTPGHTRGCICIFEKTANVLFTGDTIFCEYYGRTDLKSGNFQDMKNSVDKIFNRFSNIQIFAGHDKSVNIDSTKRRIRLLLAVKGW